MNIITILDFEDGSVTVRKFNADHEDAEEFITGIGKNPINCQWMITEGLKLIFDIDYVCKGGTYR